MVDKGFKLEFPDEDIFDSEIADPVFYTKEEVSYEPVHRDFKELSLPLSVYSGDENNEATITVVMSDLHLGDSDFMPETFESTLVNLEATITQVMNLCKVVNIKLVLNGDIVSGQGVFREQFVRNIINRGHWQVEVAATVIREVKERLEKFVPDVDVFLIKGNHEKIENNFVIFLSNSLKNTYYVGKAKVINIADPIGHYNVMFTHGTGSNAYFPVSYKTIRDFWKARNQYKFRDIEIEEFSIGHTHWLQPRMHLEGLKISVTGGFQRWEYSIAQRPSGVLLYVYVNGETSVTGIRPDQAVEASETQDEALEYKNMAYYSRKLSEAYGHLREKPKALVL